MYNYEKKANLRGATGVDTSNLASKSNLAKLKGEVDKINVDKLKTVPVDLSKLSNVVNYEVAKKTVYDKLVAKVNSNLFILILILKYNTYKSDLEKKSDTSGLVKKTDCNIKISETEGKILSITVLATAVALDAVENKIPNVSNLAKKNGL